MVDYEIVQTGSAGNCVILCSEIGIDMGVSFKQIKPFINRLRLVLLTHVHG